MSQRVKVKGIRKHEINTELLAMAFYLMGKSAVEAEREREEQERLERQSRLDARREGRHAK